MDKFYLGCKAGVCIALIISILITPWIINRQLTSIRETAKVEIQETRNQVLTLVIDRTDRLQDNITRWLTKADNRIGSLENTLNTRTASIQSDLFNTVNGTRDQLFARVDVLSANVDKQLTETNRSVATVTTAYASIPATFGSRFDRQTNCNVNELCWQNMTTSLLRDARYTAVDVSEATHTFNKGWPNLLSDSNKITTNFASITDNINRLTKPRWYDRALGYGLNGVILYRQLHPANIVVEGVTQAISSRK